MNEEHKGFSLGQLQKSRTWALVKETGEIVLMGPKMTLEPLRTNGEKRMRLIVIESTIGYLEVTDGH